MEGNGATAIVSAYALVSFSFLSPDSVAYQILNGTGAVGIVVVSVTKRAWQPALLNTIWTLIAATAIVRLLA